MKHILIIAILLCFKNVAYTQTLPTDISDRFFKIYKNESFGKGLDYLFSTNKYSNEFQVGLDNAKTEIAKIVPNMGTFNGYELISTKTAGTSVLLLTYLVKYEKDALTFRILFYKPVSTWQVQTFKYDNNIGDELIGASKVH